MKTGLYLVSMVVVGLGVAMAVTNPSQASYEEYAAQQLSAYLRDNTCANAGELLKNGCNQLLNENQSEIKELISANTQRQNYGIVSFYQTNLSVGQLLPSFLDNLVPSYHFKTVGIFNNFQILEAKKQ
ncbi:MAG: DUF4359 domain-containing protein [Leptolyngbyaceae cyanobacterium CSU_1_4]|nr:DUF4359 domain-containing protein [Leptolyngbyaceae cyanobacterium CSU_1_4]